MGVRLVRHGLERSTSSSGSAGSGTVFDESHDSLKDRDLPDQHPIQAITGLEEELNKLREAETVKISKEDGNKIEQKADGIYCTLDGSDILTVSVKSGNAVEKLSDGIYVPDLSGSINSHAGEMVYSQYGAHGLRYRQNTIQYYDWIAKTWKVIPTNGGNVIVNNYTERNITLSPNQGNALKFLNNGYFVQDFIVSPSQDNALSKRSDGYYVQKLPADNALLSDVNKAKQDALDKLEETESKINDRYDLIISKVESVSSEITKHKTYEFSGSSSSLKKIMDLSEQYSDENDVILRSEITVHNPSDDFLTLRVSEQGIITMEVLIKPWDTQRYRLTSTSGIKVSAQGKYEIYWYINYV